MREPIILEDYKPIEDSKKIEYCKNIQKQIDEGRYNIITLFDDESDGDKPKVFKDFNNKYMTQQYVGVLKGNVNLENDNYEDITTIIGSRFDDGKNQNFLNYVFSKAFDISGKIFKDMSPNSSTEQTWDMLLMLVFINHLEGALKQGILRQYRTFHYNDSKVKGKIDVSRHIKLNPIENGKVAYSTREYTVDNPINYLILLTYDCLDKRYSESFRSMVKNRKNLKDYIMSLKSSIPNYRSYNYKTVLNKTSKPIYHPYYIKYETLRKTSIMILRRLGLNIFKEANNEVFGVLIDMNKLWEKFLYKVIFQEFYESKESEYKQKKIHVLLPVSNEGNEENKQNKREFKRIFKPDFYLRDKTVFDAKYRKAWERNVEAEDTWDSGIRNDVFQVMGYMLALNVNIGGVIFPLKLNDGIKIQEPKQYKISQLCNGRFFYTIAYCVPSTEELKEFNKEMDNQNENIQRNIKELLENKNCSDERKGE